MAVYVIRAWHNGDKEADGGADEYEMTVDIARGSAAADVPAAQLRLLEAIAISLASLAESTERLARQASAANRMRAGF